MIDAHLYYHFKFMTNGLAHFYLEEETQGNYGKFSCNYRKALSPGVIVIVIPELLKKLNDTFISLGFGANGVDLHEMISFNFVEPVILDKLKKSAKLIDTRDHINV